MPFDALLLALLGGYIFLSRWNYTRFSTRRSSGERLLLNAAFAGVFFLALSYGLVRLLVKLAPEWHEQWREYVPFEYLGTTLGALLLGGLAWVPLNWFFDREKQARRVVEVWGNDLEILAEKAIRETRHVMITLRERKVYIGYVTRTQDPAYDRQFISILPIASGYRDSETFHLTLDTPYASTYAKMLGEEEGEGEHALRPEIASQFEIILPVSEIQSASLFNWTAFEIFRGEEEEEPHAQPRTEW